MQPTRQPIDLPIDKAIDRALLLKIKSTCNLVVEGTKLLGIVTEQNAIKLVATGTKLSKVKIAEVMTRQIVTLKSQIENSFTALTVFCQARCQLPIVDDAEQLVGIVTQSSLLQALHSLARSVLTDAIAGVTKLGSEALTTRRRSFPSRDRGK